MYAVEVASGIEYNNRREVNGNFGGENTKGRTLYEVLPFQLGSPEWTHFELFLKACQRDCGHHCGGTGRYGSLSESFLGCLVSCLTKNYEEYIVSFRLVGTV